MKTTALIILACLGFTALATAQQNVDSLQANRQPPVVTEQQVNRHAEMAQQERKKTETERKLNPVKQQQDKQKDKTLTSGSNNTSSQTKKSSKKPIEQ